VSAAPVTSAYVPIGPIRLADTRSDPCGCTSVAADTITVDISGRQGVPAGAVAVAVTVTATEAERFGFVTVHPAGTPLPLVSMLNTRPDRTVANSTIVALGSDGSIELYRSAPAQLVVDLTGVFVAADAADAGRYVAVATNRLIDTRTTSVEGLGPDGELTLPLPAGMPADATAIAVNVTSVGERAPGYLSARPAGSPVRLTSFLNPSGTGQAVAATTIIPVSPSGFTIRSLAGGHVIVDWLGWFTGPSAPVSGDGLFVAIAPERLLDTRERPPRIWPGGTIEVAHPYPGAAAIVTNVTATHADRVGFITGFPAGTPRPDTSTLNPAFHDHTLANLAITQVSDRGLAYYALHGSDLVVDVTGMFTGTAVAATGPTPSAGSPPYSRVLMIGDSTLASVPLYSRTQAAFVGFEGVVDAASCRRLLRPSCLSNTTGLTPNTAVEAIAEAPGRYQIVVIKAGYNDWFSDFPAEFDAVVRTARAKGAHTIIWLTQNEDVVRPTAARAYRENNADLYWLTRLPQYSDVLLADWLSYSRAAPAGWNHDGTHLTLAGTWLLTDYISRWVAAAEHRPCPRPWGPGGPVFDPCPPPDQIGPVPSPESLF
jgi:hypothetical protein